VSVFPRSLPKRLFGYHEDRGAELGRKIIGSATSNDQHAVVVGGTAWRKKAQQLAHACMLDR
jgi:hypothetical protein